jgi:hypothetical protein
MIKKLIILFLLFPVSLFAQFTDDFEDGDISNWTESTDSRWSASGDSPLTGAFSLHHILDNTVGDHDQVSFDIPDLDLSAGETKWKFRIKYDYNPSGGNNWNVFLSADADAFEMFPSGVINGYVLGVNYAETDDILRLYKITSGTREVIISTTLNWDDNTNQSDISAIEVTRSNSGDWEIEYNPMGDFGSLNSIGTGNDNTYILAEYFGIYYVYTSSADRKLWLDDIEINGEIFVDDDPPFVDSVYVQSYKNLKVGFNEKVDSVIAVNPVNYTIDGGIGNPDSISVDESYRNAELFFNQKFTDNHLYSIDIQTIEDLNGNVIKDTSINFIYEYIKPLNLEVISSNKLQIQFSRKVDTTSAKDPTNYSLDNGSGNPILAEVVAMDSTKIQLQFVSDFTNKTQYILTIQNVADQNLDSLQTEIISFLYFVPEAFDVVINEIMADPYPEVNLPNYEYIEIKNTTEFDIDLSGWKLKSGTTEKDFPGATLNPDSYLILCDNDASEYLDNYGTVLEFSSFPSITNSAAVISIFDENDNFIDSVKFTVDWYADPEKEDGGWSIERIDPLNTCSGITNWKASEDINGGTPGTENSVFASNLDNDSPAVDYMEILSDNQLRVVFAEPGTEECILEQLNYSVNNGIGNPNSVLPSTDFMEVELLFSESFPVETELVLTVVNIGDKCGNLMPSTDIDFLYYVVKSNDIVINEIMADPEPSIELPEYEYIEIYNTSDFEIDLTGWKLIIGTSEKVIPSAKIGSGEYIILCDDEAELEFQAYLKTIIFSSFPSIPNSEQTITLRNKLDQIINTVHYTDEWYKDDYKAEGGWSLEQIDPMNPCGGTNNWIASESDLGGTPGQINSVNASNPDLESPELLNITLIENNKIRLFFNESIDSISAMQLTNYNVDFGVGNPTQVTLVGPDYKSLFLEFTNDFSSNSIYTCEIAGGIFDCSGNEIAEKNTAKFGISESPTLNDIVINEVLFNPFPDGSDFIEIYNRSEKIIDLRDVYIATYNSNEAVYDNVQQISTNGYLLFSGDYLLISEDPENIKSWYYTENPEGFLTISKLPTFNDDEGRIILIDRILNLIDDLEYTEDMQFALLATKEGVALERINFERPTNDKTNWHSASEMVGFATPAYKNSQFLEAEDIKEIVQVEPEVFSPDNDGFEDFANINFLLSEPGYVANIKIYDSKGRLIRYLANNQLLGVNETITWDGLDEKSQKAYVGIYVVFIELFDLEGNVKQYKETVVVAAKY